jgi:nucleoside-diphosphate-sugar epimerase
MRIFLAGASGVIGRRLVPLLVEAGHEVAGMTRSQDAVDALRALGAGPVVCDVFDRDRLRRVVAEFAPQVVMHQLTDLPDRASRVADFAAANARIRREGTRNLIDAAVAAGAEQFIAQSVAWKLPGEGAAAVDELEQMVLDVNGVVVRYGRFYGEGTYHESNVPDPPRIQIDHAATRTLEAIGQPSGVLTLVETTAPDV